MNAPNKIHILMATYNGQQYLREQLESIGRQSMQNWMLHVCDDCSEDETVAIVEEFARHYVGQVVIMKNEKNIGSKQTFARLVREVREQGDYAFCDQDDIWSADKLDKMQQCLRQEESMKDEPVLVCSDASLIDEKGRLLSSSYVSASGLAYPENNVFEHLLLCNFVQGAATLWNWKLHQCMRNIPEEALVHDWWLALVAAGNGHIRYLPEQLTQYRQHSSNVLGSFDKKRWQRSFLDKLRLNNWKKLAENNHLLQRQREEQALAYIELYDDERAKRYLSIMQRNRFVRTYLGIRSGYLFMSWRYSVKYYLV